MNRFFIKAISTFFYLGYLPFIPGTFASIAGVFLFYLMKNNTSLHILFTLTLAILGFLVAGRAENIFGRKDARCIVIDEVSGMLLAFMFIPYEIRLVIITFFIFRILDTFKPYPAGYFQNLKGSFGIMSDDLVAGIYTNIVLHFALRLTSFNIS